MDLETRTGSKINETNTDANEETNTELSIPPLIEVVELGT